MCNGSGVCKNFPYQCLICARAALSAFKAWARVQKFSPRPTIEIFTRVLNIKLVGEMAGGEFSGSLEKCKSSKCSFSDFAALADILGML